MINYLRLGKSIEFYEKKKYQRLEAPWWVPVEIMNITLPEGKDTLSSLYYLPKNQKSLVASGEQSLLYLANQGLLTKGKFQTVTPCFRDEVQGPVRRKFFMKNELMVAHSNKKSDLEKIIDDAYNFFKTQVPHKNLLSIVKTCEGFDIEYNKIEIGSYGIRQCSFLDWVYGTGVAEPRLERAIKASLKKK
jgi:seryl-tRNA synthetase